MKRREFLLGSATVLAGAGAIAAPARPSQRQKITASVNRGLAYLRKTQGADGSWSRYPGITALVALSFLRSGRTERDPAVAKAIQYLVKLQKPNGGIFTTDFGPAQALPNYNTALAVQAIHATRNASYAQVVRKAQQFLISSQFDEAEGYQRSQYQYGGIGYGSRQDNPDVSNLQNALEALKDTGAPKNSQVWQKAITFLQRCQNRDQSNDQAWSGNDGGFVYAASGESKADEYTKGPHSSYGSMTYAGLKSYLYCGVSKSDPRAQAAYRWIRANYTVRENPKMGDDGLYYHYHTMSKTLVVYGEKVLTDTAGKKHRWAVDLSNQLASLQRGDGAWMNKNARWREDNADLVTGYAVLALNNCLKGL